MCKTCPNVVRKTKKVIPVCLRMAGGQLSHIQCKRWWHVYRQELIFRSPLTQTRDGLNHCVRLEIQREFRAHRVEEEERWMMRG